MSQEKKYQVFISSTYTDLIDARNAAINTVLESYNFPVGMEMFGADNDEQWTIIKDLIDSSDFYILIMGHRYGSISKKDNISFTEKEFDYALEKGVKLMCFVRKDNVATLPHERDEDPAIKEKISQFRTKVTTDRTCEFWDSVDDLKHKISNSLYKNMRKHGGTGWVRGNQISGQLAEEIAKLSEENRKLREENEQLKKSVSTKKPVIKISVNGINNIEYDENNLLEIFWKKLREDDLYEKPEKRSKNLGLKKVNDNWSNILILGVRSAEDYIDKYNDDLDSITDDVIKQHDLALRDFHYIEKKKGGLTIDVSNIGNIIASKVSIRFEFPSFLFVVNDDSMEGLKYYKNKLDQLIIGHIETPEERVTNYLTPKVIFGQSGSYIPDFPLEHPFKSFISETIIIECDSLLHARNIERNSFYIFPKSLGEGTIKVNIMCAEYEKPDYFEIPIQVVE